jgi:hypothetical protein
MKEFWRWWCELWWCVYPGQHKERKLIKQEEQLKTKRSEAMETISKARSEIEDMAQRPRSRGKVDQQYDPLDTDLLEMLRKRLKEIEDKVKQSTDIDDIDNLEEEADQQGAFSAYLCPREEIWIEGNLTISLMDWWGVPETEIDKLHVLLLKKDDKYEYLPEDARGKLYALFQESDEWDDYIEYYEKSKKKYASKLFWFGIIPLPLVAIFAIHYGFLYSPFLVIGLWLAGLAGACVSVITKLPVLQSCRSEKMGGYIRDIWMRIGAGSVTSLIGCGLLGWGIVPIGIQGHTFAEVLNSSINCLPAVPTSNNSLRILILLAVPMLFGFSERALTYLEGFIVKTKKS